MTKIVFYWARRVHNDFRTPLPSSGK